MILQNAKVGLIYTILSMSLDGVTARRLGALGITRGTNIKVLNRNREGSVIIMVRGSRLALGSKIAETIQMKEAL